MKNDVAFAERIVNCDSWPEYHSHENKEENEGAGLAKQQFAEAIVDAESLCYPWVVVERGNYIAAVPLKTLKRQRSAEP